MQADHSQGHAAGGRAITHGSTDVWLAVDSAKVTRVVDWADAGRFVLDSGR